MIFSLETWLHTDYSLVQPIFTPPPLVVNTWLELFPILLNLQKFKQFLILKLILTYPPPPPRGWCQLWMTLGEVIDDVHTQLAMCIHILAWRCTCTHLLGDIHAHTCLAMLKCTYHLFIIKGESVNVISVCQRFHNFDLSLIWKCPPPPPLSPNTTWCPSIHYFIIVVSYSAKIWLISFCQIMAKIHTVHTTRRCSLQRSCVNQTLETVCD